MKCSDHFKSKVLNVGLYFLIGAFAMTVVLGMGWSSTVTKDRCTLYADMDLSIVVSSTPERQNSTFFVGNQATYGTFSLCQFCTYFSVMCVIYAVIAVWFYLLIYQDFDKKEIEAGERKPSALSPELRLWLPNIFCLFTYVLCAFVSSILIADGRRSWCSNIEASLQRTDPNSRCSDVSLYPWNVKGGNRLYMYLTAAEVGAFGLFGFLAVKLGSLIYRVNKHKDQLLFDSMGVKKKKIEDILQQQRLLPENDPEFHDLDSPIQISPSRFQQAGQEKTLEEETDGATYREISAVCPKDSIMNQDNEPLIILESQEEINQS